MVGSALLRHFINNPIITHLTALTRKTLDIKSSKLTQIVSDPIDLEKADSSNLESGIFICALGTTIKDAGSKENFRKVDYDLVIAFADLAKRSKARAFFVVSALGAKASSAFFYNRVKGEMEEKLFDLDLPSCYVLRPSLLIGDRTDKRRAEAAAIAFYRITASILPARLTKKLGTPVERIVKTIEARLNNIEPGYHVVNDFQ